MWEAGSSNFIGTCHPLEGRVIDLIFADNSRMAFNRLSRVCSMIDWDFELEII